MDKVFAKPTSLDFWFLSERPQYFENFELLGSNLHYAIQTVSRGFYDSMLPMAKPGFFRGYVDAFGVSIDELLSSKTPLFNNAVPQKPTFQSYTHEDGREVLLMDWPAMKIYCPGQGITADSARQAISLFCEKYCSIKDASVLFLNTRNEEEMSFGKSVIKRLSQVQPADIRFAPGVVSEMGGPKDVAYGYVKDDELWVRKDDGTDERISYNVN